MEAELRVDDSPRMTMAARVVIVEMLVTCLGLLAVGMEVSEQNKGTCKSTPEQKG